VGPEAGLDALAKRKILPLSGLPVYGHFTDYQLLYVWIFSLSLYALILAVYIVPSEQKVMFRIDAASSEILISFRAPNCSFYHIV
jgi:hypothetical protein